MDEGQLTMTEDKSKSDEPDTIRREALGYIAILGDLYDAASDKFCGMSMFKKPLPPDFEAVSTTDNHHSNISIKITNTLNDKLQALNVGAELKLSVLAGMVELQGSAMYVNEKKKSFKSAECALVCNTTTVVEQLYLFNEEVKNRISTDALKYKRATHFVAQIYWGANCTIKVTDQNSEGEEKTTVEGNLKAHVEKLKLFSITGKAELDLTDEEKSKWRSFSVDIFGDILPNSAEKLPVDFNGAIKMIQDLPKLVEKSNDGKGKPLVYVMHPLSSSAFKSYIEDRLFLDSAVRKIDNGRILQVTRVFDYLSELVQKARDQLDEVILHRCCITDSEEKDARSNLEALEVEEANLTSGLQKVLEAVRSGNSEDECLADFCSKRYTAAGEIYEKCQKVYNAMLSRKQFMKRCEKYDVKYLMPPVEEQIAGACDDHDNVYVLFDGEADRETTQRNHSAFIDLARNKQKDSRDVFCVVWLDKNHHVRIQRYRGKKLFDEDVAKEMETKDMARCTGKLTRASNLEPFRAICPGSFQSKGCSREERSWTCFECNEMLQFCPGDGFLYCSCGKAMASRFQFRCRSEDHGPDFTQCSDEILQTVAWNYQSLATKVLKTIKNGGYVLGVTSVDDELFVLLYQDYNQVTVYSINDYQLLHHLSLPGLERDYSNDLTSCVRHKRLYVSNHDNNSVHRYDLASSATTKWSVPGSPFGLSVTPSSNLLVTCRKPNKLLELSVDSGQCVREVALQSDIECPWHGVQLTTGQYVVCHGEWNTIHRVCIVDDDGRVTRSYGGQLGSDVGQLNEPCHLAVDEDSQFIFVADRDNDRVVLLSPTLEFVRYISEGLSWPQRPYLHHATRRLYVGQWIDGVAVIQL